MNDMSDSETLLDTPKKNRLQAELGDLRVDLKTFERTFAEAHGKKPKQNDIKNDRVVAAKYKRYHRLQDAFAGKITFQELDEEPKQLKSRKQVIAHIRQEHVTKERSGTVVTPRRSRKTAQLASPSSVSPRPILSDAVGPTPHRDGKVLGLFDLLQRSGSATLTTSPSSSARKRKIAELYSDTPAHRSPFKSIQTQGERSSRREGDLLEFLTGTPQKMGTGYSNARHSRTPRSDCRKFALSQLFATPSTQRFLCAAEGEATESTPIRSLVLGTTPSKDLNPTGLDTTPAYLKRSSSFKDRLLSAASSPALKQDSKSSSTFRPIGPPTLRHFRSSTSNILVRNNVPEPVRDSRNDNDEDEDDWTALRELEQEQVFDEDVLVEDSQLDKTSNTRLQADSDAQVVPTYKKKGQKRTTKKSNIRPVVQKKADEPHFVAADNDDSVSEDELGETSEIGKELVMQNDERTSMLKGKTSTEEVHGIEKPKQRSQGRINPNAQSHMNFRSLKIKNKNSRAKGAGRNRFGKGRR